MTALSLSPQVFAILSALVEERAGLHYAPSDLDLFAQKVSPSAQEAGFDSLLDYYYFLRYDPEGPRALQSLIESLTVHETYFFREYDSLRALTEAYLVPAVRQGRALRVWCAASATGEEPLSLAMLLQKAGVLEKVELIASDVSRGVLERAQRGEFNRRSVRWMPSGFMDVLMRQDGERIIIDERVRRAVQFTQVNLIVPEEVKALGLFDAVLCRNVLIYFTDQTALRVVQGLTNALKPGGRLLVGTSESLLRFGTQLDCFEERGSYFYAKAAQ